MSIVHTRQRRRMLVRALHSHRTKDYSGSGLLIDFNLRGFNPQLGSTAGSDANDPVWLPYAGTPYLYLPGVIGNYASANDAVALDITGDIDVRAAVALSDWTPGSINTLVAKRDNGGTTLSHRLSVGSRLTFQWTPDGTGAGELTVLSTAAASVVDGGLLLVRVTMDVDNGAGGYTATFYTKTSTEATAHADTIDNAGWTQLGDPVVGGAPTSFFSGTDPLAIGSLSSGGVLPALGNVYAAAIFASVNGTDMRFDVNFTDLSKYNAAQTTITAETGQTVTLNRTTTTTARRLEVVDRSLRSYAVDDYDTLAHDVRFDPGLASFTAAVAFRKYGTTGGTQAVFGKQFNNASAGWRIDIKDTGIITPVVYDGVTQVLPAGVSTTAHDGLPLVLVTTINRTDNTVTGALVAANGSVLGISSASIAAVGAIATAAGVPLRAGALGNGSLPSSVTILGRAVYPGIAIITAENLRLLATELLA